jgi:hypothetical protein
MAAPSMIETAERIVDDKTAAHTDATRGPRVPDHDGLRARAEVMRDGFGAIFPQLPEALLGTEGVSAFWLRNTPKTSTNRRPQGEPFGSTHAGPLGIPALSFDVELVA